jgi:hypothetical protein
MEFVRKFKHGCPINKVLSVDNLNRIIDILTNIKGDGCLIEKPIDAEGRNWRIIFDKKRSDSPTDKLTFEVVMPLPLDYHTRIVGSDERESQYGDFKGYTDFTGKATTQQYIKDTMLPLGYCYLTFTAQGGDVTNSRGTCSITGGVSIKCQRKNADKLYRLTHGNHNAAFLRQGDGNSIQIDTKNYTQAPAYILRQWNTDNNYITLSLQGLLGGNYSFLVYDTYKPSGENDSYYLDHPKEIKFASPDKSWFEQVVFDVTNIAKPVIESLLCFLVADWVASVPGYPWQHRCLNYNQDEIPYAGLSTGGWICLDSVEGLADPDALAQLVADVRALHSRVFSSPFTEVETALADLKTNLRANIDILETNLRQHAESLTQWQSDIADLRRDAAALSAEAARLESIAASQRARVENLKRIIGNS